MADSQDTPLLAHSSVEGYFRDLLEKAKQNQGIQVADSTEFYLVNLLSQFLDSEKLYVRDADGVLQQEPLALILKRALERDGAERLRELRRLGDVSLYVTGFFSDHLEGKVVDADYYIAMGREAYGSAARLAKGSRGRDPSLAGIYAELAEKFGRLVDLLNEISERLALTSQQGLLRLYERFQRTGSVRIARLLAEQGMAPVLVARPRGFQ